MISTFKKLLLLGFILFNPMVFAAGSEKFSNTSVSNVGKIYTYDLTITSEHMKLSKDDDFIFDIPYSSIRKEGVIVQLYYSVGLVGSAQWYTLQDTNGVVLQPNSIMIPLGRWISNGLQEGYKIRIVILTTE